jgi:hypothetical protein
MTLVKELRICSLKTVKFASVACLLQLVLTFLVSTCLLHKECPLFFPICIPTVSQTFQTGDGFTIPCSVESKVMSTTGTYI